MTYILDKKQLEKSWSSGLQIMKSMPSEGKTIFDFSALGSSDLTLDEPHNTRYPPKSLFLPQTEVMLRYNGRLNRLEDVELEIKPRILFGIRPCDASAAALLDTVSQRKKITTPIGAIGVRKPC